MLRMKLICRCIALLSQQVRYPSSWENYYSSSGYVDIIENMFLMMTKLSILYLLILSYTSMVLPQCAQGGDSILMMKGNPHSYAVGSWKWFAMVCNWESGSVSVIYLVTFYP